MRVSLLRSAVCWLMVTVTPAYLIAEDTGAMLHGKGPVLLNGNPLPTNSSAIFPGDSIQTQPESAADITVSGASVIVLPGSTVKYEGNAIELEQGAVSVASSVGISTHTTGVIVTPHSSGWAEFDIAIVKGEVDIAARKGEMTVQCGNDTLTLPEGQEAVRDASGKCRRRKAAAIIPAGENPLLNRYVLIGGGIIGWVTVLCLFLCSTGGGQPASPSTP